MPKINIQHFFLLFFPILILLMMTLYKISLRQSTTVVTLPIQGYDPRDLLSGHYLRYRIDYGITDICTNSEIQIKYICLSQKKLSKSWIESCEDQIQGECRESFFHAGIEKFYIPEENAKNLEKLLREKPSSLRISISPSGKAIIQDLLIDGKSWQDVK